MASVRLRDLCDRLGADDQLRRRVWTTFEYCLVNEVKLMKDRHLDQFIMCAVYSICKVCARFLEVSYSTTATLPTQPVGCKYELASMMVRAIDVYGI